MQNCPRHDSRLTRIVWWSMLTVAIAFLSFCLTNRARAAEVGEWPGSTGTTNVPCPSDLDQADKSFVIRLPAGCKVTYPRLGYTLEQDLKLRGELATLRLSDAALRDEVSRGRAAADAFDQKLTLAIDDREQKLKDEREKRLAVEDERDVARGETQEAKKSIMTYSTTFGLIGLVVGLVLGLKLD